MFRINEFYTAAASGLEDLIPDLNGVRNETLAVLFGQTADAAAEQFAMLFDGDYTVDKLAKGVSALGGGAQDLGSQIQYSKLSIIVGLVLAAAEIGYCLANAAPTAGVSTTLIPGIEAATTAGIRGIIGRTLLRIDMKLTEMLGDTMIKQLAFHAPIEALQELAQGLTQEVVVQGIQVAEGTGHWQPQLIAQNGIASFIGGAAGGATAVPVGRWLGAADSKLGRAAKGMTTNFSAGISGNVAGTLAVGGEFDPLAMVVSSAGSSIGGIRGGHHDGTHGNNTSEGEHTDLSDGEREPSADEPSDLSSGKPSDESLDDAQTDDSDASRPEQRPETSTVNGNSHTAQGGARISDSRSSDAAAPIAAKHPNSTAAQKDSPVTTPEVTGDKQADNDTDGGTQNATPAKHTPDEVTPATPSLDGDRPVAANSADEPAGHRPSSATPVTEETPPIQNGRAPESVTPADPGQQVVDSTAAPSTDTASVADPVTPADTNSPAGVVDSSAMQGAPAAATPSTIPTAHTPPPAAATPTHRPSQNADTPTPKRAAREEVPEESPTAAASASKTSETPAARVRDTTAAQAEPSAQRSDAEQTAVARTTSDEQPGSPGADPTTSDSGRSTPRRTDCVDRVAQALSRRHGREIQLAPFSTAEGAPAHVLYEAFHSRAEFASNRKIAKTLRKLGPGSSAIVTSSWEGGANRGGHAYLAVNDGGRIYLEDAFTGQRSGWPPHWGRDAVSRTAVGYLHADGTARHELGNAPRHLAAAVAVGNVQGHPGDIDGSHHGEGDPGSRWRDVTPQRRLADDALTQRGVRSAAELRNPLGLMEAGSERARDNTTWWHGLTGDEQRALIDIYPHEIGNAEGIPAGARHEANSHALDQQRRELQDWRDRGQRLTHSQRKELARLERIQHALDRATDSADKAGVGRPQLLAIDSGAFGGSGRAVVSFGEDPYKADLVAWHVPGQGMTIDQLGPCMGDAINHLQSIRAEDSSVSASTIAWIGYDTPSGWSTLRAGGHTMAREGAKILYADIRAFNTARDTVAGDGSHFNGNHIFAHSYGSTTVSYAGQDGRLANDIRTVTLAGSPGAGPLQHAGEFGIGADNVFVASSSRDPFTALGGRRPGSLGRILGRGLGIDPAMESFGAHRVTAEFSDGLDGRGTRYTHNSYFRFEDRGADPPIRSESLANFGRIATGHIGRVDTEVHRTIDERPRRHIGGTRERTVEPAAHRPLRLEGDAERDRAAPHRLNARWRGEHAAEGEHTNDQQAVDHDGQTPESLEPPPATHSAAKVIADEALADRGISADDLVNPFKNNDSDEAHRRACENATWWAGLSDAQHDALVHAFPRQVGSAEGIFTEHRDAANRARFQVYRDRADQVQEKINRGEAPGKDELKFLRRVNKIDMALRNGEVGAARAGVGGPKLLYFDPMEFGKDGRAIVSFGEDPYKAENVAWLVPGFGTTIDKLNVNMRNALHLLESALREKPTLSASSIAWIGYDAPNDKGSARVTRPTLARRGGEILYSDIRAFNGARDTWVGDGSSFTGNHIFAHSYGSTTTSYAGHGGRLGDHVTTITLLGSPGAAELQHAKDFRLEPGKVFVASSSRDPVTAFGGRAPGEYGRINRRLGLGVDPAMKAFGAVRVTAEQPAKFNTTASMGTHTTYYQYVDAGAHPPVRNESLANFGRIFAGHLDEVHTEEHRTIDESRRRAGTVEPAADRPLRLDNDTGRQHSRGREKLLKINPRWRAGDAGEVERLDRELATIADPDSDDTPADLPTGSIERTIDPELARIARDALGQRIPPVTADELVNPLHQPGIADARARRNATWWAGLTDDQRHAVIHAHANQIGNAEGIYAADRDAANRTMLDLFRERADAVQANLDDGEKVSDRDLAFLLRVNKLDTALHNASVAADEAGVGPPLLIAFDPPAFNGDGRAIVSFGDDPYTAKSVSWYVPGVGAQMDRLDYCMHAALNILQSTRHESPTLSAASIAWIGYDAPNGAHTWRATGQTLARNGGHILYSDIRGFSAARDTWAGDGSHFNGNHIFGHSYGSTTTSYAGARGRLSTHVTTITLIGSPGAGPIRHASAFDIGDNVFVASSSLDRIARLGGLTPTSNGRIGGLGLGTDPAMESFGGRRVTAEFLPEMNRKDTTGTHNAYFDYLETSGPRRWLVTPDAHIRTEALANLGRIAAGHTERLHFEEHRTRDEGGHRVEPAAGRRLHHDDATTDIQSADRPGRFHRIRKFFGTNDCGPQVLHELSALYPQRRFGLRVDPAPGGVPARHLFLAAKSGSRFATYDDVTRQLQELGRGSSALLVSRWSGSGQGGHAYLAINTGEEIVLYDPHTRERSPWPPGWGQDAVKRTAVGYLKPNGRPLDALKLDVRKLGAADTIGAVRGLPTDEVLNDALAQRVPPVSPHELRNPVASPEEASARARANATWWKGLSDTQQQELIDEYPEDIGNAEGIPAEARHISNQAVLQQLRMQADHIRTRIDEFGHPSRADRRLLDRVDRIDLAVRKATADAAQAGLPPPKLLALDLSEFSGRGRVVMTFGEDPYHADKVSWLRATEQVERLGAVVRPALEQLQADHQQTGSASAVVWVGDESKSRGALHSDVAAFHTVREAWAPTENGEPFTGNRIYTVHSATTTESSPDLWVPREDGSLVVAHRGASHEFPEQTLAAYQEALRQGADGLECDVRLTKDGQLVCIHDKRIDRTSNGTGRVRDMTLAELQQFDFGSRHPSHELGDAQGDTGILTLDDLVQLVKDHDRPVTLFIEAKEHGGGLERELVALLNRHGLADPSSPGQSRVAVISFYPDAIWRVHRGAPDVPTVLLGSAARHLATRVGATAIGPSIATLRAHPEIVDIAARQGLTTYCWTVNDESDVQFARDLGVGFIATDHPGRTTDLVQSDRTEPAAERTPVHQTHAPAADVPDQAAIEAQRVRAEAEAALAQRIPPVRPDELRNPLGPMEESRARARNNAAWWDRLTEHQKQALVESFPNDIGNAEGIPAADRNEANRRVVDQLRQRADQVQSKIDDGVRPTRAERKFLQRVNRLDLALRKAGVDAELAGVDGPLLLAFDPAEFGGDGRAVLSFGEDPYKAKSVSWHVPGVATTMDSLFGFNTECALNQLKSTLAEDPAASAASIAWIGYDAPSGLGILRAAGHGLARTGGDLLHSDITAFNAARDTMAGDGSHFSGNHVFGYSYGSTTTGYAGDGGRLAGEITTVSLVGSPGAGPLRHADEFGIGADHVFVASSSQDVVTALGGRTPDSAGRILGIGLGIDPAMDTFGAQRVMAEFPPARNTLLTGGTHHAYFLDTETGGRVRSESLTNFGRIAAGHHDQVTHEPHRTADGRHTVDPAAQRSRQRIWNPRWRSDPAGAHGGGITSDPDFPRRQEDYRAQDPTQRHVDTRYADRLGDVVDSPTRDSVNQLARDLSGRYGPYRIHLEGELVNDEVMLTGEIFNGDTKIGTIQRSFYRDGDGNLVAYHSGLVISEKFEKLRGQGFSKVLTSELERYYVHSGVDRIGLHTHDLGGYAWARRGFTWDPDPRAMQKSFDAIKFSASRLRDRIGPEARVALDDIVRRLDPSHPRLPEPIDIAILATRDEPELGRRLLDGLATRQDDSGLNLVKHMPRAETASSSTEPHSGFKARIKRLFGLGGDSSSNRDCAHAVADELSTRYYGRDFDVANARSRAGTPAWALFEAAGTQAESATYDDVPGRLDQLGDGAAAILVSRWADGRSGGHAYLAVRDGSDVYLHDAHTGERSGWPPHWGQDAVSYTAAGYLWPDGSPEHALDGTPLQQQLVDADLVGDVRGHPQGGLDFQRHQAEYRAQDLTTRHVDTRYAEPLADVVDNTEDIAAARRLADDLSGVYGPYRIRYDEVFRFGTDVRVSGDIYHGDTKIGRSGWIFDRAPDGHLVVTNSGLVIDDQFKSMRGQGFSRTLTSELERYFVHSGVDRIELHTHDKGGYAWPRMDYTWNPDTDQLRESLDQVRSSASRLRDVVGPESRAVLDDVVQRLDPNHPRLPEPIDLVNLVADGEPELGRRLMEGSSQLNKGLNLVKYMPHATSSSSTTQLHSGLGARIKRMFGLGEESRSNQDCAHLVADELSGMYGQEFQVAAARSPRGTPAWALFEAVNARAEFATYDDVPVRLRELGNGSAAVLTSRWAHGGSGGHAYLAVLEDDEIYLYDPHTGERSGWPPHWGQEAVSHTAAGYLKPDGSAEHKLNDEPLQQQLKDADAVGHVQGHPADPDFLREQADYRGKDPMIRTVETAYAEPLASVVDNASDLARVRQLADDLSGVFGPYRVEQFRAEVSRAGEVIVGGHIFSGDEYVGFVQRTFVRDADGHLVAHHNVVEIDQERFKFKGFSRALSSQLEAYYRRSGVDRIELRTENDGGDVWARRGFTWNSDPDKLRASLQSVKDAAQRLYNWVGDDARALLRDAVSCLDPRHPRLPEPAELAVLATADEPDLGRQLMYGTQWHAVKYLRGTAGDSTTLPHSELDASPDRGSYSGDNSELHGTNCAHLVAHELWEMYELEINLDAPTASGVPARVLFEAVGSNAGFATYDQVAAELRRLGPGSSAILASQWAAGRQGGHAYLAANVGGDIVLVESHSGRQLGWPPYWGQHAVARTAVGYLDSDGVPLHKLTVDVPLRLQLAEADAIGDVQGHPVDGIAARAEMPEERYPSPDDVELAEFRDQIGQLDPATLTPDAIAEAVYQAVPTDDVTNFYEGRVSGFKTGEVIRAQHHVAGSRDDAYFVSADIANLRGLNQASANRTEANAHFAALADIFHAGLVDSGADVVPMRVGGDELSAIVVGDVDQETIDSAVATIRARVQEYAQQHNLSDIPHPKHPGQPEYNGVGLHIGFADVLPAMDVRDIFNIADLGVDQSKTRRTDVAGGPGRAAGTDGADSGGATAARRGVGTRTGPEAEGREGEAGRRAGAEAEHGRPLTHRTRYPQPEEVKRAKFVEDAAQLGRDPAPETILALRESLRTDEVSGFYDGRGAAFKTGEVARAREWAVNTGRSGFLVSAQMDNLSGLNQHTQNRAEVANAHYRAVTQIFRTEIEATGAAVVPMRTGGDRFDAIVVGRVDAAAVDVAIAEINRKVAIYTRREGLSDIANPSNPEQRGVHLRFGHADITTYGDVEDIVQTAERRMFGRNDPGDPRREAAVEPDVDVPLARQPDAAEYLSSPRTQQEYRAQDRTTRNVDTQFAQPVGDVLDNAEDQVAVDQLAKDLSGVYRPYRVVFRGEGNEDVFLTGVILRGNSPIGKVELDFFRDTEGRLVASIEWVEITEANLQRRGFLQSLVSELERYCRSSDVALIRLATQDNGGIAWARMGFTWDRDPERLQPSLDSVKSAAYRLRGEIAGDARALLDVIAQRLDPHRSDLPEPRFLTELATRDVPDLGRRLMDGTTWFAVKYLGDGVAEGSSPDVPLRLGAITADAPSSSQLAEEALAQRVPPVSVTELVHPMGDAELAVQRAHANATWWQGLSEDLRQALVENHPVQIGNAEGIPPSYCHEANTRALHDWLRHRDQLQSRRDAGFRLGFDKQRELDFLNNVDDAMQRGAVAARQVGVGGPHLLRFDPTAFDGNGIAIVSFGVDPHSAESVSWHIPGRGAAIDQLGAAMGSALNQMSSVLLESPTASAASITWIGYNTIADGAARAGGENLYSDIRAFNAGRDAWAADGSHFSNNHVYGHCQGSTVVGYAGVNARLDRAVRAVILFGSPGMGPINHAGEFGPGVDVYVAASSTDPFTWDAGHTPGSRGVFLDGFGVDPAMEFFGAQRITAEFPLTRMMAVAPEYDPHNWYYKFDDKPAGLRTESLANFGRIAAGHIERVGLEDHRTVVAEPDQDAQVREPASVRPAVDDHGPPAIDPIDNCAHGVADLLSARYPGRDVRIEAPPSPTGLPARALFEAVRSGAEFTDYQSVAARLLDLGPGSAAVLASRWAGVRHGGHAYLAVNDGDTIHLMDPRTGRRTGWPPHWGEIAVAQTAAGFLDSSGEPVWDIRVPHDDLVAADAIGNVQGGLNDPVSQLGLPDYERQSLSDVDANTVYRHGEHRMRELNEQLIRDGVSPADRARILSEQRNSLRAWTRDLMSNRTTAEALAANESNHTFADLVARHEEQGLVGDAAYEAIIDTATHSRYAPGTLTAVEITTVYSDFEHRLRALNEQLIRDGVSVDERARALSDLRSSLRIWTRELMANRAAADWLATNENPLSFEDLVARKEARGLVGDAVYEDIIDSATHSHYPSGTLSDLETRTVYTTLELRMREVHDQLLRDGVDAEERARTLYGLRASIRTWARVLMSDREAAESLDATDPNPTFEALVERQRTRGRVGDEIYEAIIASATRSRDSVNKALGIDPENPPPLPPMRGPTNNE